MKTLSKIQTELMDLRTNSLLKIKLEAIINASDIVPSWQSLIYEHFSVQRNIAQNYTCLLLTAYIFGFSAIAYN